MPLHSLSIGNPHWKLGAFVGTILFFFIQATLSSANPEWIPFTTLNESKPIDYFQDIKPKKKATADVQALRQAYQALQKKDFSKSISLITKRKLSPDYADYGFWILSQSYRGQASQAIEKKQSSDLTQMAKKAIALDLQIEEQCPYSPFLRNIHREIALSELTLSDAFWKIKNWKNAKSNFEKAMHRLSTQNNLSSLITLNQISHYAESCKKNSSSQCLHWLQRLYLLYSKKSSESAILTKYFPSLSQSIRAERQGNPKPTQTYKSPDQDQQAFEQTLKLYQEGKYDEVIKSFTQFLEQFSKSSYRYRAKFLLAQALNQEKDYEKAQKNFLELHQDAPLTYYGLLSANALGKSVNSLINNNINLLATDQDSFLSPVEKLHLDRAENFIAERAFELAGIELRELKMKDSLSSPFLAYLAVLNSKARNYLNSFQILSELSQRGYQGILSDSGLKLIFPTDLFELISKCAQPFGVDPILVLSLIKQESGFDQAINSPAGAIGLMQIMPSTAIATNANVNIKDLKDSEQNIRLGVQYLKKLLSRFNGNIVLALIGYNAGPNVVDRWLRETPPKNGMLGFIESIPYRETREYVSSIIRNYFWYSAQFKEITPKTIDYFWNSYSPLPLTSPGRNLNSSNT